MSTTARHGSTPPRAATPSEPVANACRILESETPEPSLDELAARVGLSATHLHRLFKANVGMTPKAYAAHARASRMREALSGETRVTDAINEAGYGSTSRFYERSDAMLGMTPSAYRGGGADETIRFAVGESSLGSILVAATCRGVCAILMGDDPEELVRDLERRFANAELVGADEGFEQLVARVVGLVEAPADEFDLPLDIRGTAFQRRVWEALRRIPAGTTASYSQVAEAIGSPTSSRAVAAACGANSIAVAIPCHRVVRAGGELSGYRWGIERKAELLRREGAR